MSVKVWIDKNFIQTKGSGEVLTSLEKQNTTTIIEQLPVENSIFWTRPASLDKTKIDDEQVQHDHIIVKMEADTLINYLNEFKLNYDNLTEYNQNELVKYVRECKLKAQVNYISFIIHNFNQFIK
jgi:hypothetical protein